MKNALNSVKISKPTTSAFDLSHDVKLSLNMGELVPVLAMECLPGDRVRIGSENLCRLAPMLAPMMHRVDVRVEYFFVPNRLVWQNWEKWITNGGDNPADTTLPAHPYAEYGNSPAVIWNSLMDYMGLPDPAQCPTPGTPERFSPLCFAAYQKIYDEFYRDENLINTQEPSYTLNDGDNSTNTGLFTLRKRAWEADYFTKALPWAQKGSSVDVPLGDVVLKPDLDVQQIHRWVDSHDPVGLNTDVIFNANSELAANAGRGTVMDPNGTLTVDATTINDLRLAFRLQEWLEKNARGGTRYAELIRAHFNVSPQDSRLQRPEYIVGMKNAIQISEVLNTTGTVDAPQGNMAGHGVTYANGNWGKYFCQEHGYIIGILSIMPKTAYQQGIPRHFLKYTDPTELAWPSFAHLGEQEVQHRELMAFQGSDSQKTFGYMPRFMEYKTLPSRVAGDFRGNLDFWHMGRIFSTGAPPRLNQTFVEADPTFRVFAVTDSGEDHIYCQVMHHLNVVRALPFYGTPTY